MKKLQETEPQTMCEEPQTMIQTIVEELRGTVDRSDKVRSTMLEKADRLFGNVIKDTEACDVKKADTGELEAMGSLIYTINQNLEVILEEIRRI